MDSANIKEIPVHDIQTEGTQSRAALNQETVSEYAECLKMGVEFPSVKVFFDGECFYLADGFHRLEAAKAAGLETIQCDIEAGNKRDALKWSLQANCQHGLRRTNEDKRHAVTLALADAEWGAMSNRALADLCGVSDLFVGKIRSQQDQLQTVCSSTLNDPDRPASKRLGLDGKMRPATQPRPAAPEPDDEPENIQAAELEDDLPEDADGFDVAALEQQPEQGQLQTVCSSEQPEPPSLGQPRQIRATTGGDVSSTPSQPRSGTEVIRSAVQKDAKTNFGKLIRNLHALGLKTQFENWLEEIEIAIHDPETAIENHKNLMAAQEREQERNQALYDLAKRAGVLPLVKAAPAPGTSRPPSTSNCSACLN